MQKWNALRKIDVGDDERRKCSIKIQRNQGSQSWGLVCILYPLKSPCRCCYQTTGCFLLPSLCAQTPCWQDSSSPGQFAENIPAASVASMTAPSLQDCTYFGHNNVYIYRMCNNSCIVSYSGFKVFK